MWFLEFLGKNGQKSTKGSRYFMDKKKFLTASLASVAVLGSAFVVSQPSVVKAEG